MSSSLLLHRLITSGTLMVWASVLCVIAFTGRIDAYLAPAFRPYAVAAGCVLALLAALTLVAPQPSASCGEDESPRVGRSLFLALVLIGPLVLAFATSQDGFTANAVLNRTYVQDVSKLPPNLQRSVVEPALPGEVEPALPEGDSAFGQPIQPLRNEHGEIKAEVIDLLYAAQLPELRPEFENQGVEIIGQLMPARAHNPNGDRFDVIRMFMMCCAADAQPVAITIAPRTRPEFKEMTWVKVRGTATFPVVGGQVIPLIDAGTVEQTTPPEETFLY